MAFLPCPYRVLLIFYGFDAGWRQRASGINPIMVKILGPQFLNEAFLNKILELNDIHTVGGAQQSGVIPVLSCFVWPYGSTTSVSRRLLTTRLILFTGSQGRHTKHCRTVGLIWAFWPQLMFLAHVVVVQKCLEDAPLRWCVLVYPTHPDLFNFQGPATTHNVR